MLSDHCWNHTILHWTWNIRQDGKWLQNLPKHHFDIPVRENGPRIFSLLGSGREKLSVNWQARSWSGRLSSCSHVNGAFGIFNNNSKGTFKSCFNPSKYTAGRNQLASNAVSLRWIACHLALSAGVLNTALWGKISIVAYHPYQTLIAGSLGDFPLWAAFLPS